MSLFKIPFDGDKIKLSKIYENPSLKNYKEQSLDCPKIKNVYGDLKFSNIHSDRPYTFASFVTSIDGKIAFNDAPEGPFIAQKNFLDSDGASADFWVLNMLRANADAIMVGAVTMQKEAEMTAHIFDEDMENSREKSKKPKVPYNIVTSIDGSDIPFDHILFNTEEVPVIIFTSPQGLEEVKTKFKKSYFVIGPFKSINEVEKEKIINLFDNNKNSIPVIITGENKNPDSNILFKVLKLININKLLIESPTYSHYLIENQLLDEVFLNYSCIYIGGNALNLGAQREAFTSSDHPHTEMLSIHTHSPHFFYFRHKIIYGINS